MGTAERSPFQEQGQGLHPVRKGIRAQPEGSALLFWEGLAILRACVKDPAQSRVCGADDFVFHPGGGAWRIWFVPLGSILDAYGMHAIKPYAFASTAVAAFISPLMFGAMADRHVPPARVLRWTRARHGDHHGGHRHGASNIGANQWLVLALIQVFALTYSPMFSISTALVLARLQDAKKEFGPVRSLATLGWMARRAADQRVEPGPLGVCGLSRRGRSGCSWRAFTYFLPRWRSRNPRSIFRGTNAGPRRAHAVEGPATPAWYSSPRRFSTSPSPRFIHYAPTHLHDLGFTHTSAWMSLAQVTEIIAMFSLAWLLANWRLKWIFAAGIGIGVARFALSA